MPIYSGVSACNCQIVWINSSSCCQALQTVSQQGLSRGVKIVAATANGMPKEDYEPIWEYLFSVLVRTEVAIRIIWIAGTAQQGDSAILNEQELGNDPNWFNHSCDLLQIMNIFQNDMPRPLIGIGHGLGSAQMVFVSNMHPKFFSGVVLIDPLTVSIAFKSGAMIANATTYRKDFWQPAAEAEESIRKNPFFKKWDSRVVSQMVKYSFTKNQRFPIQEVRQTSLASGNGNLFIQGEYIM